MGDTIYRLDGKEYHLTSAAERFIVLDSILKKLAPYDENDAYESIVAAEEWEAMEKEGDAK